MEKLDFTVKDDDAHEEEQEQAGLVHSFATRAKDFTVMANLVKLFEKFVSSSPPSLFRRWVEPVSNRLVRLAAR